MSQRRFTGAKIVIFGSAGVGKTAFAVRYITKRYIGDYDRDREMLYTHKLASSKEDVLLEILDTASEPSPEVTEKHVRWGEGFILMYSLTDKTSFTHLNKVKDVIDKIKGHEFPLVLVGNKTDLQTHKVVTEEDAVDMATRFDCPQFEISVAESSQGVLDVMEELMCLVKREFVKNASNVGGMDKPKSKLFSMKKAFKKRINRSHSDTF